MADSRHDVIVVGAGMVGATAACLLSRAGFAVAVVESHQPAVFDHSAPVGLRVSAISPGAADVLAEAGAWRIISRTRHCAYRRMHVEDRDGSASIDFNSAEFGLDRLGTLVENGLVQSALWQCLNALAAVEIHCPERLQGIEFEPGGVRLRLQNGHCLSGRLLVGADGADSAVRRLLGIGTQYWAYGQSGIVAVVHTERMNTGLAWQRFMAGGPLALLPLADGSSSMVWSRPDAEARRLLALDDAAFCREVEALFQTAGGGAGGPFGTVLSCGPRAAFPLRMQLCETYAAERAVLLGDAAHVVHPLAGQGVNIGLLDAAALVEVLLAAARDGSDFGAQETVQKFARWRRSEAEVMARGIHGIRSLFQVEPLGPVRKWGLALVARSWYLRELFIRRASGHDRGAPALARGRKLSDLLRQQPE